MTENFAFWPHTKNKNIASFRLRCLNVIRGLSNQIKVSFYSNATIPKKIILSKRYDKQSVSKAIELREKHRVKVYIDLCDNHFYYERNDAVAVKRAAQLRDAISVVDGVTVSSEYLKKIVLDQVPDVKVIEVIDDVIDLPVPPNLISYISNPYNVFLLIFIKFWLRKNNGKLHLVWFGNHSGGFSEGGMDSIIEILSILNKYRSSITLTVISNSRAHYRLLSNRFEFESKYIPWNVVFFDKALQLHDSVIIPVKKNPFNLAKTSNRVATSLLNGLQVIADSIPSYKEFENNIFLDDYDKALNALIQKDKKPQKEWVGFFQKKNTDVLNKWKSFLLEDGSNE